MGRVRAGSGLGYRVWSVLKQLFAKPKPTEVQIGSSGLGLRGLAGCAVGLTGLVTARKQDEKKPRGDEGRGTRRSITEKTEEPYEELGSYHIEDQNTKQTK